MRSMLIVLMLAAALSGCARTVRESPMPQFLVSEVRETRHVNGDDLLSAGLGLDGLRAALPAPADAGALDAAALRRRAIHSNWHGIADLAPGGGFGDVYGAAPDVPGREYSAFAKVPGASQPHRVLAQVPDAFDAKLRCLVVTPVSGSRGVYGSIAFAGAWALPRGCAIVYTDKGAGSGWFDADTGTGVALDGTRAQAGRAALEFEPAGYESIPNRVLMKHAHSGDNPEADWGRHVIQAMQFGLHALDRAFPALAPFTPANTRILAFGLSNGGGAVLRAAELPEAAGFAAVVAAAPNIYIEQTRPLYDYTTQAALLQPCALLDPRVKDGAWPVAPALLAGVAAVRCASLAQAGVLGAKTLDAQAAEAYDQLRASGWDDAALRIAPTNVGFDVWRAVGASYLPAYARLRAAPSPCGHVIAALGPDARPRATTSAERALWWSDGSGLVPSLGVGVSEPNARLPDPTFAGLTCLRAQWDGGGELASRVRAGVAATAASGAVRAPIVALVHGVDDGLIPPAFTSRPYAARAHERSPGATVRLYEVEHAQHFDAFIGLPAYADRFVPLIPYAWRALDLALAQATGGAALPPSARIATTPRASGEALARKHLGAIEALGNAR